MDDDTPHHGHPPEHGPADLGRALASIASQDAGTDVEVLVVAACGPRHRVVTAPAGLAVRLVVREGPLGRAAACNAGLDESSGEFVTFLDDDDELLPNHLSAFASAFAAWPDSDLVHARSMAVAPDGELRYLFGGPWVAWRQLTHGFAQLGACMFRRALLAKGIRFDERLEILEDMDFLVQCAQAGRFHHLETPVLRYYVESGDSGAGDGLNRDDRRVREALAYLQAKWRRLSVALADSPPARLGRARAEIERGDLQVALATLQPLLDRIPPDVNALNYAAVANIHLRRYDRARELLRIALYFLPAHPGLLANLELLERAQDFLR
jgi:glycosyltransferase involved in cell wall biosynthesis